MKTILVCLTLVSLGVAELPSYIKPCSRDDPIINKCFVESANNAIQTIAKGDKKLEIPTVIPELKHPGAKYQPSDEFLFHIKPVDIVGVDTSKLLEAKVDFKEKTIWFRLKFEVVDCKGTYVAKALKEKDEVEDKLHIIFTDNYYFVNMNFDVKDNHISIVNVTVTTDGKPNIEYHLENIDKHPAVNALWEKYQKGFEKVSEVSIAKFFTLMFGKVFKAATFDEVFPPKA